MPVSKLSMSAGVAIETIETSTRIMKKPMTSAHSAGQGLSGNSSSLSTGAAPAWVVMGTTLRLDSDSPAIRRREASAGPST